jgi:GAF domain-containing protein
MRAQAPENGTRPMATHERILQRTVEIIERTRQLAIINAIAAAVTPSLDLDRILSSALHRALELLDFEAGGIYLLDDSTHHLILKRHQGEDACVSVSRYEGVQGG